MCIHATKTKIPPPPPFTFEKAPEYGGKMSLVAPECGPVFVLQRGHSVLQDVVERVFGVADDEGLLGDAADVVGDVGDTDDDEDRKLPRGHVAPKRVAVSVDQRGHEGRRHDRLDGDHCW